MRVPKSGGLRDVPNATTSHYSEEASQAGKHLCNSRQLVPFPSHQTGVQLQYNVIDHVVEAKNDRFHLKHGVGEGPSTFLFMKPTQWTHACR
jgi:hypothetical protein